MLFTKYRLDNFETDESQYLDGWSYFCAALGGLVYVLARGFPKPAAVMLLISIALATTAAVAVVAIVGLLDDPIVGVIAILGISLGMLSLQSLIAIQLMRIALIRQGWREGY
jgi:hypothetical protein